MGRGAEDIFDCRACGETVVYEPAHERTVDCHHCGARHSVQHFAPVIRLLPRELEEARQEFRKQTDDFIRRMMYGG